MTYSEATDEILKVLNDYMPDAAALVGYVPDVRWPGVPEQGKPDRSKYWIRPSHSIVKDGQSSISSSIGKKRYRAIGLLFVQVFCPRLAHNTLVNGRKLAEAIRDEYRKASPSGNIEFRDQEVKEIPSQAEFYQLNVVVTFEYDTIQ
jgi:hypothetical protein